MIDLPADKWLGSPIRIRDDSEDARIQDVRGEAAAEAASILAQNAIDVPAMALAMNADGEPDAAAYSLRFGTPGYGLDPVQTESLIELEVFNLPSVEDCVIIDNETKGFALRVDGSEITRDTGKVPRSRGCAMDYRVFAVFTPADIDAVPAARVAIISVYPFGFEGPDRRFIAVPLDK